jgi:hypothetical protein
LWLLQLYSCQAAAKVIVSLYSLPVLYYHLLLARFAAIEAAAWVLSSLCCWALWPGSSA